MFGNFSPDVEEKLVLETWVKKKSKVVRKSTHARCNNSQAILSCSPGPDCGSRFLLGLLHVEVASVAPLDAVPGLLFPSLCNRHQHLCAGVLCVWGRGTCMNVSVESIG